MTDVQFRSFGEVFAAKLAEQSINVDPAYLPADPSECDAFVQGDGTHLAGTVFEAYVESWGWETLKPLLEAALAATSGVEWTEEGTEGEGTEGEGEHGADDRDAQATWVYNLLCAAGLENSGLDPYCAPDGAHVVAYIQGDFADSNVWPELGQVLEAMEPEQKEQAKQALKSALDQVGQPPASQW